MPVLEKSWAEWKGTKAEFLKASQLLLVYLIKELGILDQITAIDVGPWVKHKLAIHVKGSRKTSFSNSIVNVEVNGDLELPNKPRQG